jgi:hypothetical protein
VLDPRSAVTGLEELGGAFMTFENEEASGWTTLAYEEVVFVISGEVTLAVKEVTRSRRFVAPWATY